MTETMNALKKRDNCIYLLNFQTDLKLSVKEGILRLKAQYDDDDEEVIEDEITFHDGTRYLLGGNQ